MDEITQYNLAINELKQQKLKLDKEIAGLFCERDKVCNEIADQRNAKTVVYHEQKSLENIKYFLNEQTKILSEVRSKNYENFSQDYTKHKTILEEIGNSIEQSKKLLSDFDKSKEDVEIMEQKKKEINNEIVEKRKELAKVTSDISKKSQELDLKIAENKELLRQAEEKEKATLEKLENMRQYEKNLQLLEKRLKKQKLSLVEDAQKEVEWKAQELDKKIAENQELIKQLEQKEKEDKERMENMKTIRTRLTTNGNTTKST